MSRVRKSISTGSNEDAARTKIMPATKPSPPSTDFNFNSSTRPSIIRKTLREMPKFKVADHERIGSIVPEYMHYGVITEVIPNNDGLEWATEYEVRFSTP
jgi:hypothetical protein